MEPFLGFTGFASLWRIDILDWISRLMSFGTCRFRAVKMLNARSEMLLSAYSHYLAMARTLVFGCMGKPDVIDANTSQVSFHSTAVVIIERES